MMCECKDKPKNKCEYPDDCLYYDDYLFTLPVTPGEEIPPSYGDDGICRTFPGASFWYD